MQLVDDGRGEHARQVGAVDGVKVGIVALMWRFSRVGCLWAVGVARPRSYMVSCLVIYYGTETKVAGMNANFDWIIVDTGNTG